MDRPRALARVRVRPSENAEADRSNSQLKPQDQLEESIRATEDVDPFSGEKMRRLASVGRECRGDYLNVQSYPYITKFLSKQGVKNVLLTDKVLKFTESGRMKRRILLITDFAVYLVDPETENLKRRIPLVAVGALLLSELNDTFLAMVVPTEYDCLMATTRKTEIVKVLVAALKTKSEDELIVSISNRFEYKASCNSMKEVHFEETDGGVRTRILRKEASES